MHVILDVIEQGYSTIIRIGPIGKVHYLHRSRKKFIAALIPKKKKKKLYQPVAWVMKSIAICAGIVVLFNLVGLEIELQTYRADSNAFNHSGNRLV